MSNVTDTFYAGESIVGYGSQWLVGDGASPESFEAVADVMTITPGDITTAIVMNTHLRSPDGVTEKDSGMTDLGPFSLVGNYRPTHESQSNAGGGSGSFVSGGLLRLAVTKEKRNHKIKLADGTEFGPFRGFVSKFQLGTISGDERVSFTAEVTPSSSYLSSLP